MAERSGWTSVLAQSLKVAAVVMVLGYAVVAAEQRLAQDISPEEIVAAESALTLVAGSDPPAPAAAAQVTQAAQTASR